MCTFAFGGRGVEVRPMDWIVFLAVLVLTGTLGVFGEFLSRQLAPLWELLYGLAV